MSSRQTSPAAGVPQPEAGLPNSMRLRIAPESIPKWIGRVWIVSAMVVAGGSPLPVFRMRIRRLPGPPASIGHLQRDVETAGDSDLNANSRLWIAGESRML